MQVYQQGNYLLILEPALCKGCNLCVKSCPTGILYLSARGKIATTQEAVDQKCIFCRICEMRCPDFAIWVVKPTEDRLFDSHSLRAVGGDSYAGTAADSGQ